MCMRVVPLVVVAAPRVPAGSAPGAKIAAAVPILSAAVGAAGMIRRAVEARVRALLWRPAVAARVRVLVAVIVLVTLPRLLIAVLKAAVLLIAVVVAVHPRLLKLLRLLVLLVAHLLLPRGAEGEGPTWPNRSEAARQVGERSSTDDRAAAAAAAEAGGAAWVLAERKACSVPGHDRVTRLNPGLPPGTPMSREAYLWITA